MNATTINSRPLRLATLLVVALLGCLFLMRPTLMTRRLTAGPASSFPPRQDAPAPARIEFGAVAAPAPVAVSAPPAPVVEPPAALIAAPIAVATPAVETEARVGFSDADRTFIEKMTTLAAKDEEISRTVLNRLVYPEVREYAYGIIEHHVATGTELKALAAAKGMTIPAPEVIVPRRWGRDSGSVDQYYVHAMGEENQDLIALLEPATRSGDADVAAFARKTLAVLQGDLNTARDLTKITD